MKGGGIIGDIWYFAPDRSQGDHPDLKWLDIQLSSNDIYSFDIFLILPERGNNFSALLQNNAMHALYKKGYENAFAFYWADNIPAVWNYSRCQQMEGTEVSAHEQIFVFEEV